MTDRELLESIRYQISLQLDPVDCVLSDWRLDSFGPWGECQPGGTQTRDEQWVRDIVTPPQNGGAPCGPQSEARIGAQGCTYVPPPTGEHAYFDMLAARQDCVAVKSFRDQAQIAALSAGNTAGDWAYIYPTDPDPRKQDGVRIRVRQGRSSPLGSLAVTFGQTNGQNLFVTVDLWMGAEWDSTTSLLVRHKNASPLGFPVAGGNPGGTWFANEIEYTTAHQFPATLPPGGPFVAMLYPHMNVVRAKNPTWWRDSQAGFPPASLPYTAPANQRRGYEEAIQPFDTSLGPAGQEVGLVAERWARLWHFFERAPGEDYTDPSDGAACAAYKWSFWFADTVRDPICMLNEAIIGIRTTSPGFWQALLAFDSGGANAPANGVIRPDLVAYERNFVALRGTSKVDVMALLQKPVA